MIIKFNAGNFSNKKYTLKLYSVFSYNENWLIHHKTCISSGDPSVL